MSLAEVGRLREAGCLREALRLARELVQVVPSENTWRALGLLELDVGSPRHAAAALRDACAQPGTGWQSYCDLGVAESLCGRIETAVRCFERASLAEPRSYLPFENLGSAYLALNDPARADAAFEAALMRGAQQLSRIGRARALFRRGAHEVALTVLRSECLQSDFSFAAADALMELGGGDASETTRILSAALEFASDDARTHHSGLHALRLRALKQHEPGKAHEELGRWASSAQVFFAEHLTPRLRESLAERVRNHRSMTLAPTTHATREGQHSGNLLLEPEVDLSDLEALLRSDVQAHLLKDGHIQLSEAQGFVLDTWAVRVFESGSQVTHFHPRAIMSGCLYLNVPRGLGTNDAGCLGFGFEDEPPARVIVPENGLMVIFLRRSTIAPLLLASVRSASLWPLMS